MLYLVLVHARALATEKAVVSLETGAAASTGSRAGRRVCRLLEALRLNCLYSFWREMSNMRSIALVL